MTVEAGRNSGSILIVVLWVILLMSIIAGDMVFEAHLESMLSTNYKNRFEARRIAGSGLQVAELLMRRSVEFRQNHFKIEDREEDRWDQPAEHLARGLRVNNLTVSLGKGKLILSIIPEPAKRNVNKLFEDDWERILEVGNVPEDLWPTLIDSFNDWKDSDNEAREAGAETEDYYSLLDHPYKAKNGNLDSIEELLLIKGFNRTILYGGYLPKEGQNENDKEIDVDSMIFGIADLLTVYGDGRVNVNAASKRVLMTLPGIDDLIADQIIEEREGITTEKDNEVEDSYFKDATDFFSRIQDMPPLLRNYIAFDSKIYKIVCVGEVGNVKKSIQCIGSYQGNRIKIIKWLEE